jgi:hypothetical protein
MMYGPFLPLVIYQVFFVLRNIVLIIFVIVLEQKNYFCYCIGTKKIY